MDRKWRFNKAGYETVLSVMDFRDRIPPCPEGQNTLVTSTDLYAMYTWLHIERKEWELRWSEEANLYYFLVTWQDIVKETKKKEEEKAANADKNEVGLTVPAAAVEGTLLAFHCSKQNKLTQKSIHSCNTGRR